MRAKRLLTVTLLVLLFGGALRLIPYHQTVPLKKSFDTFPLQYQGWQGNALYLDGDVINVLKMSDYLNRGYQRGTDRVGLYVGYYATQTEGAQIHSPKGCLPASGWLKVSEETESMEVQGFGRINFVKALYQKDEQKELFLYWYQMRNVSIADEFKLRFLRYLNSVRYGRNDAAFIRISMSVAQSEAQSSAVLKDFMKSFAPLLKGYLVE